MLCYDDRSLVEPKFIKQECLLCEGKLWHQTYY